MQIYANQISHFLLFPVYHNQSTSLRRPSTLVSSSSMEGLGHNLLALKTSFTMHLKKHQHLTQETKLNLPVSYFDIVPHKFQTSPFKESITGHTNRRNQLQIVSIHHSTLTPETRSWRLKNLYTNQSGKKHWKLPTFPLSIAY